MRKVRDTFVPPARTSAAFGGVVVRSYVLDPYELVKDLRTGVSTTDAQAVLDGDIDMFMVERLLRR